jgi:hypothetical protein
MRLWRRVDLAVVTLISQELMLWIEARDFSPNLCVHTSSEAHPGGLFSGGKARPGLHADHSPPASAEVENE